LKLLITGFAAVLFLTPFNGGTTACKSLSREKAITASTVRSLAPPSTSDDEITLAAVGDVMLGSTFPDESLLPPNDGANLLDEVKPILSAADITFGNLEGPMIDGGVSAKCPPGRANCYAFRVPTRYGRYLKEAGFDVMSLANNHAMDFGAEGRASSARTLDALGIAHSGAVGDIARLTVKGKRIALIAFATYPTSYNLNDLESAKKLVADLTAANDIVIVSFHGGAEGASRQHVPYGAEAFFGENRGDLRRFSRAMIDVGADLVIGHGPHVVRGMEVYRNRLIAYSLGNFATYGRFSLTGPLGLSLILQVRLTMDGAFAGGKIYAVKQEKPGGPRLDPTGAIIPLVRQLSIEDFGASSVKIGDDGELSAP
jgi:poly-gamma-glutamate capsule biosynthesis protein CapA/YwtB (metallophosphatase superfamily)